MLKNRKLNIELEAGVDEAGAGCGFGPVFAAACILPIDWSNPELNDSKKLTEKKRERLFDIILKEALSYSITEVSAEKIDQINILQARFLAMDQSIKSLSLKPEHILIDGDKFYKTYPIPFTCVVKGDSTYTSIAAASILAKVTRDRTMLELSKKYDKWNIQKNKGYLTKRHIELIKENGLSELHRKTFCTKIQKISIN
jgi:ribonuclease HII